MRVKHARPGVLFKEPKAPEPLSARDVQSALCKLLDNIEGGGSIATSGVYSAAPLPGLFFQGYDPVPLPLAQCDADAICKDWEKGKSYMVKKSVAGESEYHLENRWELKSDDIKVRNPAWTKFVQNIAVKAAKELGIKPDAGAVKAEISKAYFQAAGAHVPPYKDIPNVPGCFGKLLICLPAAHEGGALRLMYPGDTKKFLTEPSSSWGYSYAAWYNDVILEFQVLTWGHRLMLEYDLVVLPSSAKIPTLGRLMREKDTIRGLVVAYNNNSKEISAMRELNIQRALVYSCDSHYASQPLSLSTLQGKDQLRAACLRDVCATLNMGVFIADLHRTRSGFCEYSRGGDWEDDHHGIETEDEDLIELTKVVDVDGETISPGFALEEEHFLQDDVFDIPDDEDYDYHNGFVTHHYLKTVLILVPSEAKGDWLPEENKESRPNKRKRSGEIVVLE